jgi:CheY-like chemotaxis protein
MSTILIADDQKTIRLLLGFQLRKAGYEVLEAEDGSRALEIVRGRVPDLIISDMMMPGLSGEELFRAVRGELALPGVPFLFLSAREETAGAHPLASEPGVQFLSKPYQPDQLLNKVGAHLAAGRRVPA